MTEPIKIPSNFSEVLMAVILPYHTPEPEELLELISETGVDAPQDIIVVEDGQLSYIPSKVVETI